MSSVIWRMISCRSWRVSGVFSTASISVTTSLTFSSRSASALPSALNRRGPSRGMISLWTRVLSSAKGSATTDVRSASSGASPSLGSVVATWMRECSDIRLPHSPTLLLGVGGDPLGDELVGDVAHRLDHARARVGQRDRHSAVDRGRDVLVGRELEGHLQVERPLDLVLLQADLGAGLVQKQVTAVLRVVQQVERLQGELHVLDGGNVHRGDQQELVGTVERREHRPVEERRRVDDDDVVALLGDREQMAEA